VNGAGITLLYYCAYCDRDWEAMKAAGPVETIHQSSDEPHAVNPK
jgi:hypothetical protein